ncbi:MAG: phosphodiester glycosidase family protein [Candidatus Hydrogenedentota bacterium]
MWRHVLVCVLLVLALPASAGTTNTVPFAGVRHVAYTQSGPYPLAWHLVIIDRDAAGIRFTVTEPNGDAPADTDRESTKDFAARTGVQVAVNASFFAADDGAHADVLSLAAAAGTPYSPWNKQLPAGVNIAKDNTVTFVTPASPNPTGFDCMPPVTLHNAVAGNEWLVRGGQSIAPVSEVRHPRTAIGLHEEGELLLLVVDGRHGAHSRGATYQELAEILVAHGAKTAINLDGGGSSTLVFADPEPRVVNVPMPFSAPARVPVPRGGITRPVGNNLGVYAAAVVDADCTSADD